MHPSYFQPSYGWPDSIPEAPSYARYCDPQNSYLDNPYVGFEFHPIDWAERVARHGERKIDQYSHEWAEATKHAADSAASGLRDAANRMAEIPEKSTKEIADTMKTIAIIGVVGVAGIVLISAVLK